MKRRVRKIANFFAFNLLFFALYLNFIHKDKIATTVEPNQQASTAAFSGTVLVENPAEYIKATEATASNTVIAQPARQENASALKLSIN